MFGNKKYVRFIEENGKELAQHMAYHSASAAQQIAEMAYGNMTASRAFESKEQMSSLLLLVISSLRAQIELNAIRQIWGQQAFESLLDDILADSASVWAGSTDLLRMAWDDAQDVIRAETESTNWPRQLCMKICGTRDPEDEGLHMMVAKGISEGGFVIDIIKNNA